MPVEFHRVNACECTVQKPFEFNESIKFAKRVRYGKVGPQLPFRTRGIREGAYKSVWGGYDHSGVVYINSTNNLSLALTRITGRVVPGDEGKTDLILAKNQVNFFSHHPVFRIWIERSRTALTGAAFDYTDEVVKFVIAKHSKRRMRMDALRQLISDCESDPSCLFTGRIVGKMKQLEFAKPDKYPRLIGDFSCPGSLLAGWCIPHMKDIFDTYLPDAGGVFRFVASPDRVNLRRAFSELIDPRPFTFVFHSDDSCISFKTKDGRLFMANMDISKCDASNRKVVFDTLLELSKTNPRLHEVLAFAVLQCELPLHLVNPVDKHETIVGKPVRPIEFSGTTLTTVLNNIANMAIGLSIYSQYANWNYDDCMSGIERCAFSAGYVAPAALCESVDDLQFLKHSPALVDGDVVVYQNLGVMLRAFGQCDGDLPMFTRRERGIRERSEKFSRGLVSTFKHAGETSFLRALRARYPPCSSFEHHIRRDLLSRTHSDGITDFVPDEAVCRRYKLTLSEFEELCTLTSQSQFGDRIFCVAAQKILKLDYGL